MKPTLPLLALIILTGCASNVVPAGPDTYYISYGPLPITMSAAKAKAQCYRQASAWCVARGLVMVPVSSAAQDPVVGIAGHAELTFHALKPGDPDIKRANIEAPDTTKRIETR
ncbi:MAG TPA: hypothetical protein DCQ92_01125 [Verrucomicrobia subdivision 3 bacterium]|nr:hypothetical protein [Limisphaerales bacterium]